MLTHRSSRLKVLPAVFLAVAMLAWGAATGGANAQSPASRPTAAPHSGAAYAAQQIHIPRSTTSALKKQPARTVNHPAANVNHPAASAKKPVARAGEAGMPARSPSLIHQAAHGRISEEQPPAQFGGSAVRQVSCGCAHCSADPMHADFHYGSEPGCGITGGCGIAGCHDPGCGFEVGCGLEAACGVEALGCDGYGCDVGCCSDCVDIRLPIFRIDWRRYEFFAGVNGFTGPANHATDATGRRGGSGSFGFYEGFNKGRSLGHLFGSDLAAQLGLRATQSSLSGAEFTERARKQIFVTGGLFRRVDFGLQYGLVVDYLYDDWWFRNNLVQLRGELSWNDGCGHEFGYQFMAGTKDTTSFTRLLGAGDMLVEGTASFEPTNQHRLFLRGNTLGGGSYMAFAGGTDRGDGLLGVSLLSAFRGRFAVQGGATYLIPNESNRAGGYENEAWNLAMGVVFRPGGKAGAGRYCRPMFDVADNGTFMVDRR